jgi:N-methylhydantoinase B
MLATPTAVDPVTFQVILSRLSGIVQEMQDNIFRTGYSTIVRESKDASALLVDRNGDVVGEHLVHALHIGCIPDFVKSINERFGDEIAPGDAFFTNHPYVGGVPHTLDIAVVTPVFYDGSLVGFAGSTAHKSDLGGVHPGTGNGRATDIYQEGVQYPPMRIARNGRFLPDVEALVRANSRTPELVLGDIRGQVGVGRLGERRLAETIERYGLETVLAAFAKVHDVAEARIRAELRRWPDGVHEGTSCVDFDGINVGRTIRHRVRVEKTGDRIVFDFTETDDQADGPVNIQPGLTRSAIAYALIGMLDPSIPNNGGVRRVAETRFREGSVVKPTFPAPTNQYMASCIAVTEAVLDALSGFVPSRRLAATGGVGANSVAGKRRDGSSFVQFEPIASAYGASARGDGASGCDVLLSNCSIGAIEILESEYPTRVRRFELIPDSGGPGRYRGGCSPRRTYEVLADDAQWALRGGRNFVPASGADGGSPGRVCRAGHRPGTPDERAMPSRFSGLPLRAGDIVLLEKAGGGGVGDPQMREFERVVDDVLDGHVTRQAAIDAYGADPARLDAALASWDSQTAPSRLPSSGATIPGR